MAKLNSTTQAAPSPITVGKKAKAKVEMKRTFSKLIKTPAGRLIFPSLDRPDTYQASTKFRAQIIVDLDNPQLQKFLAEMEATGKASFADWSHEYNLPVELGEDVMAKTEKAKAELYAGKMILKASSVADKGAPKIFLADKSSLPRETEADLNRIRDKFYPGAIVSLIGNFFSYQASADAQGVSFLLKGVQFLADGQRLGSEDETSVLDDEVDLSEFSETDAVLADDDSEVNA